MSCAVGNHSRRRSARRARIERLEDRRLLSVSYNITDLGAFPSGNGRSSANGLNSAGQVVGFSNVATDGTNHPFLYSNGSLLDLNPGGGDSEAMAINDSGQVVGKNGDAFLYSGGVMQHLGTLGGFTSWAYAINNSAQIAGDSQTSDPSITHAFLYSSGRMQDLGTLGGSQSNAFGINDHGDVAGLAYAADGVAHAFLYSSGRMQDLGQLWGRAASMARAVNDSGQVVGYGYFWGLLPRHAFLYSDGSMTDLQTLGGISSAAWAINAQGQVVGDSNTSAGADHAFLYSNGQMQDLNSMVAPSSGWVLQQATAINNAGQIAGTGIINGQLHAFLLTPVPVPATGAISGVVFNDANGNGSRDGGEGGLGGWLVYVDLNGNGQLDPGEPAAVTAADGTYTISGLAPGTYTVREVLQSGFTQTAPGGGAATVNVSQNQTVVAAPFGNAPANVTPVDTTPPSAQIVAPDITTAGAPTQAITIVYTDNVAVNAASINAGNIVVTGPSGPLNVVRAGVSGGNGSPLVATYTVAAPDGVWSSADNGSYVVALKANQVSDTSGNFAGGASGSFTVSIAPSVGSGNDQSFNNGQAVNTNFVTEAIITQPDGKVLAVGRSGDLSAGTSQGVIERFNADGTLDRGFGANGMIVSQHGINEAYFAAVMQDANHFVVAGTRAGDFVLARYDLNGKLDGTFGSGGRAITDFGSSTDTARGIAIAPDGAIVVAGDSGMDFAFARYDVAGNLDRNFAQSGRQLYALGDGASNGIGAVAVQSDGRIVAVGAEGASVVVVRLTASGEADGTFGSGGLSTVPGLAARTDLGTPDRSEGLALETDGEILVANRTAAGHFGLVRVNSTGSVDTTFGINGLVTANFGGDDDADSIVLQSSGPIVLVGTSLQNGTPQAAVAAFDASGGPLSGFGSDGMLLLPGETPATSRALHVGDIVLRAFGAVTSTGSVIIGTTDEAVAATTSSTLRRIIIPGAQVGTADAGALVGTFGVVNGKVKRLTVTDQDGTRITFALTGGTGQLYQSGDRYTLVINDLGRGVILAIGGRGGDGRVSLADVTVSGTLRAMNARNSDIYGTLHVTGAIGTLNAGNVLGTVWSGAAIANLSAGKLSGNLFAAGALGRIRFSSVAGTIASGSGVIGMILTATMDNARVLSGANMGADGTIGGSYAAGAIGSIKVSGAITSSFIGAGVNPVDRTFGNMDDTLMGSAASDRIQSITARGADQASRFEAGAFGSVRLPKTIDVLHDPRIKVL